MAGETKPAPLLKQTKKKDCFNRREASVIDSYFIHTFYPTPSIFRVKRWQSPVNALPLSPPPSRRTPPILFLSTQTTKAYQPTRFDVQATALEKDFLTEGLPKFRCTWGLAFVNITLTGLSVGLAWLVRAFANHLLKPPLSHSWLATFYKGGDGKTEGNRKKVNKPHQPSRM